jgi:hypothetical protein
MPQVLGEQHTLALNRCDPAGLKNDDIQVVVPDRENRSPECIVGLLPVRLPQVGDKPPRWRPIPGQKFVQPMSRMGGDPGEDIRKPRLRVDAVIFAETMGCT